PNPANPNPANPDPTKPNPANPDPANPGEDTTGGSDGGSSTDGGAGTCTVDLDGAECVDNNPDTNNAGSQPVEQGKAKEELAETGAAETTFLIIGAATMIAGGIGFRMLPRLVAGGRAAV
ncbi:LPXTG cell wall anchor domain-containing protein, partial [Streptomyces sp. NPDC003027]